MCESRVGCAAGASLCVGGVPQPPRPCKTWRCGACAAVFGNDVCCSSKNAFGAHSCSNVTPPHPPASRWWVAPCTWPSPTAAPQTSMGSEWRSRRSRGQGGRGHTAGSSGRDRHTRRGASAHTHARPRASCHRSVPSVCALPHRSTPCLLPASPLPACLLPASPLAAPRPLAGPAPLPAPTPAASRYTPAWTPATASHRPACQWRSR